MGSWVSFLWLLDFVVTFLGFFTVHGTWVSERRIEPGVPVELNEGDTIKIGGSTRVYRLHWVPLTQAYDEDNPFVSPMDLYFLSMAESKEVENQVLEDGNEVETHQVRINVFVCQSVEYPLWYF